jgi:hypothetical protein
MRVTDIILIQIQCTSSVQVLYSRKPTVQYFSTLSVQCSTGIDWFGKAGKPHHTANALEGVVGCPGRQLKFSDKRDARAKKKRDF